MNRTRAKRELPLKTRSWMEPMERRVLLTSLPSGFTETVAASGLGVVSTMDVLPDGRLLVSNQTGKLEVVKNGSVLATPALTLNVDSSGERGLLGVVHDPNFASNGYIYLYHTIAATGSAAAYNEVSRFTMTGDIADPASEVDVLRLNDLSGTATNHNGGSMHFGLDGDLYIGVGENANPPNSQTLSTLLGKVLRINVSTIQAGDPINDVAKIVPTDNPFVGTAAGIDGAIYALGFRNPFTFAVNPSNGEIFINDVGQNTWEEIDKLVPGGNYGWGLSEGFAGANPPSGLGPGVYQDPQLAYNHSGGPAGGGVAITGGVFYIPPAGAADPFPASYNGKYFYEDLGEDYIRVFDPANPGSAANPDTSSPFATGTVNNPVDMALAPDGGIYYLARANDGEVLEISPTASAVAPSIIAQPRDAVAALHGSATFGVSAGGAATLNYQWQRSVDQGMTFINIVGQTAASLTLNHLPLSANGDQFRVVVSDTAGSTTSSAAGISVAKDHAPRPRIVITSGLRHGRFDAGTPIAFTLTADDAEDGAEPASRFTFQIDYITSLHSVRGGVARPFVPATGDLGAGAFTPAQSGPYTLTDARYRVTFTVTDAAGVSRTITRTLAPNVVHLTLRTSPAGLSLTLDGQSRRAPISFASVVGFSRLLDAPVTETLSARTLAFASWSDGGAASHTVITPTRAQTIYTATFSG